MVIRTPVLTKDSMIRSFIANVSPCFIFILFLSKHFIAYLKRNSKFVKDTTKNIAYLKTN